MRRFVCSQRFSRRDGNSSRQENAIGPPSNTTLGQSSLAESIQTLAHRRGNAGPLVLLLSSAVLAAILLPWLVFAGRNQLLNGPAAAPPPVVARIQPATPAVLSQGVTRASNQVQRMKSHQLDSETKIMIWDLRLGQVKTFTARLLAIQDRKVSEIGTIKYEWFQALPAEPPAIAQLVLSRRDVPADQPDPGLSFSLGLEVEGTNNFARSMTSQQQNLGVDWQASFSSRQMPLNEFSDESILSAEVFRKTNEGGSSISLGSTLDSVLAASDDGRLVVAVQLLSTKAGDPVTDPEATEPAAPDAATAPADPSM